jgi:GGDEF domain-containing protein
VYHAEISVSELAYKYGYTSTEAFSRAFSKVNCVLPSEYRKGKKSQAVFDPLQITETGIIRKSPLLIEAIHNAKDCYIICFDVAEMVKIHEISKEAEKLALLETVQRIHVHAASNIPIFRIGRDEFALITPYQNVSEAEAFAANVLKHNGDTFFYKNQPVPLYLRSWYGKNVLTESAPNPAKQLQETVKYQEFTEVQHDKSK